MESATFPVAKLFAVTVVGAKNKRKIKIPLSLACVKTPYFYVGYCLQTNFKCRADETARN